MGFASFGMRSDSFDEKQNWKLRAPFVMSQSKIDASAWSQFGDEHLKRGHSLSNLEPKPVFSRMACHIADSTCWESEIPLIRGFLTVKRRTFRPVLE